MQVEKEKIENNKKLLVLLFGILLIGGLLIGLMVSFIEYGETLDRLDEANTNFFNSIQ